MSVRQSDIRQDTQDSLQRVRVWFIRIMIGITFVMTIAHIIVEFILFSQNQDTAWLFRGLVFDAITVAGVLGVLFLLQTGRFRAAATILITVITLIVMLIVFSGMTSLNPNSNFVGTFLLVGTIAIVSSATLGETAVYILSTVAVVTIGIVGIIYLAIIAPTNTASADAFFLIVVNFTFVIISVSTRFFTSAASSAQRVSQRTSDLLAASSEVGQIIAKELNLAEVMNRAVELIRDRFAFYHVQIFLVDDNREYADLAASTGEVGQKLLARKHRLKLGSRSVIGRVTQVGEPVIALDTDRDKVHAVNELLPNTRSELAIPLLDGTNIIGALDVQSTRSNAFSRTDIEALQIMANQLATAIRNARLFEAQATNVQENKRLLLDAESNLREIQRLNRQLTKAAWSDYLGGERRVDGVTLSGQRFDNRSEWTAAMLEAVQRRRPISDVERGVMAVPIILRGEVLGAIELETESNTQNIELIEMAQSVAQRLAISLDNARLFEEAQEATAQEQRINTIGLRYQSANTVDELLQITLMELRDTLGAAAGTIRLGGAPIEQTHQNGGPA